VIVLETKSSNVRGSGRESEKKRTAERERGKGSRNME
jgi:hypothetical protein